MTGHMVRLAMHPNDPVAIKDALGTLAESLECGFADFQKARSS